MRTSRVLRDIREGRQAACVKINITHPNVVELAGLAWKSPEKVERSSAG